MSDSGSGTVGLGARGKELAPTVAPTVAARVWLLALQPSSFQNLHVHQHRLSCHFGRQD